VLVEKKAALELKNGSALHVMPGAKITLTKKARLRIGNDCQVVLHGTGALVGNERCLRKLRKQGRLVNVAE
jgi:hypothetical protein